MSYYLTLDLAAYLVVSAGLLATYFSLVLLQDPSDAGWRRTRRAAKALDVSMEAIDGFSYRQLALVSLLGLFLELLMIRWISSEIRIFAYFKNFVLIACFLGFGVGCSICRKRINLAVTIVPLLFLTLIVAMPWHGMKDLINELPSWIGSSSEVQVWGVPYAPRDWHSYARLGSAVVVIAPMFALIALMFLPIGQMLGWYLENAKDGINAYTINLLASLAGIAIYTLLCFLSQPPVTWFAFAGVVMALLLWRRPRLRWAVVATFVACCCLMLIKPSDRSTIYWSPYQKLALSPENTNGEITGYTLNTNGSWYQHILDLSDKFARAHPGLFADLPLEWNSYNIPYHFYPAPKSALVLGAGMGNDVAAALRNGAERVVAVEIDPLILRLGGQLHFEKPYDSPRVVKVVDDARSYVQNSGERFDLIVFSLLDSHTTSSHFSNIRIDNYVYTREALTAAKRLLKDDGVFIIKFQVNAPWISSRLYEMLTEVFGYPPAQVEVPHATYSTEGSFFIIGSQPRIQHALREPRMTALVPVDPKRENVALITDDWPYFYQRAPGLPLNVIVVSLAVVLFSWIFIRKTLATESQTSIRWHFFFLGAAFLLLEALIISKMALLFGTTWVVNSIVISGLMLLIVAANFLAKAKPHIPLPAAYTGILVSIGIAYFVPLNRFFFHSVWLRALSATAVLCLPVFFAGIIFIRSFAESHFDGEALGSNLLGALVGGVLESLSFWTGLRSLLLLAAVLYIASAVALQKQPRLLGKAAAG